jgi:putative SOS response-associated peptidase YedK
MCGRFTLKTPPDQWSQLLLPLLDMPTVVASGWVPRFNIAPTQNIVAIATDCDSANRFTGFFRWGLVPSWSEDLSIGNRMINARSETITEKRSFVGPLNKRRCAIIADGYYEWKTEDKQKQPYWIHPTEGGVFAMAGLWENNRRATGEMIRSCTIITAAANETLASVHDRMPVVLNGPSLIDWLDFKTDAEAAAGMLKPSPNDYFEYQAVDKRVNNARFDDADCLKLIDF